MEKQKSKYKISALKKIALLIIPLISFNIKAQINEDTFQQYLTTKSVPDPELLIRTSGEYRISNFLLWQIAYSELYFTDTLWPDFSKIDLEKAILDYQSRERRFGQTTAQIQK